MSAVLQSQDARSIYPMSGMNFAPKRPLLELASRQPVTSPNNLQAALKKKYDAFMKRDDQPWREQCDIGQMIANLRSGKMLVLRNAVTGAYMFVKPDGRFEDRRTRPGRFQFYSTKLESEWLSSRPELDPICPSDDDQIEDFIDGVKIVQDYYETKFYTDSYESREFLSAADYGTYVTRYRYDPQVEDIVCELLDFPACRWDIRKEAEDSSYFIYESRCSNAKLEHLLDADIAPEDIDSEDSYGLNIIRQVATQGGSVFGEGKSRPYGSYTPQDNENTVTEMWLQPEELLDITLDDETETIGGQSLKKGCLADSFPNGLCAIGINGMTTIPWIYAENHKEHIVVGIYHIQSFAGIGKGLADMVDAKKDEDDLYSQKRAYVKGHSMPCWGFNSDVVTEDKVRQIGQGRKALALDFSQAQEGAKSINDVIQHLAPGNPGQAVFQLESQIENDMQLAAQVTEFTDAFPGVNNKTATGAEIGQANAQKILVPQHRRKADHRRRSAKVYMNLFKRFVNKPKFFETKDISPITHGKYFDGQFFDKVDIDFAVVENSEVAKTPKDQEFSLARMFQATGGVLPFVQVAQMNPEVAGDIASAFGVQNLTLPQKNEVARVCRRRLESAKKLLEMELMNQKVMVGMAQALGQPTMMPDNSNLALSIVSQVQPPFSPQEKFTDQKMAWFADLLDTDEMSFAAPELRQVIEELIKRQAAVGIYGQAQLQAAQSLGNVMANAPMIAGQQAMSQQDQQMQQQFQMQQQQAQMQQQQQQAAQQTQQQIAMKVADAQISEQKSQADDERARANAADAHARALQLKSMEQQNQGA